MSDNKNLLDIAVEYSNSEMIKYLLEKGLVPKEKTKDLIIWSVKKDELDIFKKFGILKESINYKTNENKNLLMIAIENNSKYIGNYLIENKINVKEKDNYGLNSLMYTAKNNSVEIAKLILKLKILPFNPIVS